VADYCHEYSHWRAHQSLSDWLIEYDVPGISGVDTRMLTKIIRDAGEMRGKIVVNDEDVSWDVPELVHPVSEVSCKQPYTVGRGDVKIVAVDTGMKDSMLRCLVARGATVKVVPYNHDFTNEQYDGLFLSNGPGDPTRVKETTELVRQVLKQDKPVFGICLGTQLMVSLCFSFDFVVFLSKSSIVLSCTVLIVNFHILLFTGFGRWCVDLQVAVWSSWSKPALHQRAG
jgi:carbamoyl-phosphate synthase small subunit